MRSGDPPEGAGSGPRRYRPGDYQPAEGEPRSPTRRPKSQPLASLQEAQSYPDGIVTMRGDNGGQTYVVAPAARVGAHEPELHRLLCDLDEISWPGQPPDSRALRFWRQPVGSRIAGGMGGGFVEDDIWVHPRLVELGLEQEIRDVLAGTSSRMRSHYDRVWALLWEPAPGHPPAPKEARVVAVFPDYEQAKAREVELMANPPDTDGVYQTMHTRLYKAEETESEHPEADPPAAQN